jgi:hypothetical protein
MEIKVSSLIAAEMQQNEKEINEAKIVELFNQNVKGKISDTSLSNIRHDGKEGHWLEQQMGIRANGSNSPDLFGFEMKNQTASKTSFGDWSANYYIFKGKEAQITRSEFLCIFGKPNDQKGGRYSWAGAPCPKINSINNFGQQLLVDDRQNILAIYSFSKDKRTNKSDIVPNFLQKDNLIIAKWDALSIKKKLERKFNQNGWFKCVKDINGYYNSIVFGEPISYLNWIELVKRGVVFFDSGMYDGNVRPYSMWRANNDLWESLIVRRYP